MLTPKDIHDKEFKKALRGYDMDDVDQFLDRIIKDMEELTKQNAMLKERVNEISERVLKYSEMENSLNRALILADKTADTLKTEAIAEGERIITEANRKAEEILNKAENDAHSFHTVNLELIDKADAFKQNLISLFETQIASIRESSMITEDIAFKKELEEIAHQQAEEDKVIPDTTHQENSVENKSSEEPDFSEDFEDRFEEAGFDDEEEDAFKNKVFTFLDK